MKYLLKISPTHNDYTSPWNIIECKEMLNAKIKEHKITNEITEYIILEIDENQKIDRTELLKLGFKYEPIKEIPKDVNKKW